MLDGIRHLKTTQRNELCNTNMYGIVYTKKNIHKVLKILF